MVQTQNIANSGAGASSLDTWKATFWPSLETFTTCIPSPATNRALFSAACIRRSCAERRRAEANTRHQIQQTRRTSARARADGKQAHLPRVLLHI